MNQITTLSDAAYQQAYLVLDDGSIMTVELIYRPAIQRWSYNIAHTLLNLQGQILCVHPNLLFPWRNLIPFGLACTSSDGTDPISVDDFAQNRIQMFSLKSTDVTEVNLSLFAGSV